MGGTEVGEHSSQPAIGHIGHAGRGGSVFQDVLGLFLRAHEHHRSSVGGELLDLLVGVLQLGECLAQVDNMDPVALSKEIGGHLRVAALGLMPEMDTSLQQLLHSYCGHSCFSCLVSPPPALRLFPELTPAAYNGWWRHAGQSAGGRQRPS